MGKLRSILARHRGLIVALMVVLTGLAISNWARQPRPMATWTDEGGEFLEMSPDGRRVLTHGSNRALVREVDSGRTIELKLGSEDGLARRVMNFAKFLDDGRTVLGFFDEDESIRVWDAATGRVLYDRTNLVCGTADAPAVSADGSTVAFVSSVDRTSMGRSTITAWSRAWGHDRDIEGEPPMNLSEHGDYLASTDGPSPRTSITVHEARTGRRVVSVKVKPTAGNRRLALSHDGTILVETTTSETVFWDLATTTPGLRIVNDPDKSGMSESFDPQFLDGGKRLSISTLDDDGDDYHELWDPKANPPAMVYKGLGRPLSDDGRRLFRIRQKVSELYSYELFDIPTSRLIPIVTLDGCAWAEFSRDGRTLLVAITHNSFSSRYPIVNQIPGRFRPQWFDEEQSEAQVFDAITGRRLTSVVLPPGSSFLFRQVSLASDGSRFIDRTLIPVDKLRQLTKFDLYDVRQQSPTRLIEVALDGLMIAAGFAWDVRRRRGLSPSAILSRAGLRTRCIELS